MTNIFYSPEFRKEINLTLLTIYDKSERSTISDKEIKDLLNNI